MTATTEPRAPTPATAPAYRSGTGGEPWAGTGWLLRLYLRLDRIRTAIWLVALAATLALTVVSLEVAYPDAEARQSRAALMSNPSAVMMSGPAFGLDNYTFGAMVANEISLTVLVAVSIMSILLMVRHTRAEEESGRMETVRALPVGRFAPATAALLAVATADLLVGAGTAAALVVAGLDAPSSLAFGLAVALTGMVFGTVAAVTSQVTEHARAASGMALAGLGVAFLARGVGDIITPTGSWLSWLSPIAWAQQTRLYVDLRWWPLVLSVLLTLTLLAVAVSLARRRDLGAGLRRPTPGPARAGAGLLSVPGLARRLLTGTFLGWAVGLGLFAVAFGALATSMEDAMADLPDLGEFIAVDPQAMTESFAAVMLSFLVLGAVAQSVTAVLRLRSEDDAGRLALLIATGASRTRVLLGWLAVVAVQAMAVLLLSGVGLGVGVALATGDGGWVLRLTGAALVYLPAVLVTAALAAALAGNLPGRAGLVWVVVMYMVFVAWIAPALNMPQWSMDLSPVQLTPLVPSEALTAGPLVLLSALTVVLVAVAVAGMRRRDLLS